MLTIRLLHAVDICWKWKLVLAKKKKKKKIHIFRFCPTFDMSYLNVVLGWGKISLVYLEAFQVVKSEIFKDQKQAFIFQTSFIFIFLQEKGQPG